MGENGLFHPLMDPSSYENGAIEEDTAALLALKSTTSLPDSQATVTLIRHKTHPGGGPFRQCSTRRNSACTRRERFQACILSF